MAGTAGCGAVGGDGGIIGGDVGSGGDGGAAGCGDVGGGHAGGGVGGGNEGGGGQGGTEGETEGRSSLSRITCFSESKEQGGKEILSSFCKSKKVWCKPFF